MLSQREPNPIENITVHNGTDSFRWSKEKGAYQHILTQQLLINASMPQELFTLIAYNMVQIENENRARMRNYINNSLKALLKIVDIYQRIYSGHRLDPDIYKIIELVYEQKKCQYEKWTKIQSVAKEIIARDDKAREYSSSFQALFFDVYVLPRVKRRWIEAILNDDLTLFKKHFEDIVNSAAQAAKCS